MKINSKIRIIGAVLLLAAATSKSQAQSITTSQSLGTFHDTWATIGGPASSFSQSFGYNLFDTSLGTLQSVEFCLAVKGYGDWMGDYGGGEGVQTLNITLTGGQAFDVDGGAGWLGAGWVPVINNFNVTGTVSLDDVAVPFWIMSPQDGPGFSWGALQGFNLPNTSAFIGSGVDSATFSTYGLLSYLTDPNVKIALEGHEFTWKTDLSLKYTYAPVPEPSSAILLGSTLIVGYAARRRRKIGNTVL